MTDPRLLVGRETFDDAGVFVIAPDLALVQTVDFFAPIVDDPYLFGQIAAARSFVGGDPLVDTEGHGTLVAGEIAAKLDTTGIVGLDYGAQLVIAKVVRADGTIPIQAEANAIRWVADQGARVINLSLGGVRDPAQPNRDTFSQLEADAVAYATAKGALLVAAVGNSDEAYATPWPYASWPSALPHVIGVGALTRSGSVPDCPGCRSTELERKLAVFATAASGPEAAPTGPCGACGHPGGPGACALN